MNKGTNYDVTAFGVYASKLPRIPRGIELLFPNLRVLLWGDGKLSSISASDLEPFPNLQALNLYQNELVSLDGDFFKHTPNIVWVVFTSNLIQQVGYGIFDGLNMLAQVNFRNNSCIDFLASASTEIQDLKMKLSRQCSPATTTEAFTTTPSVTTTSELISTPDSRECPVNCIAIFDDLEEEIAHQRTETAALLVEIAEQNEVNSVQQKQIAALIVAIAEMGKHRDNNVRIG